MIILLAFVVVGILIAKSGSKAAWIPLAVGAGLTAISLYGQVRNYKAIMGYSPDISSTLIPMGLIVGAGAMVIYTMIQKAEEKRSASAQSEPEEQAALMESSEALFAEPEEMTKREETVEPESEAKYYSVRLPSLDPQPPEPVPESEEAEPDYYSIRLPSSDLQPLEPTAADPESAPEEEAMSELEIPASTAECEPTRSEKTGVAQEKEPFGFDAALEQVMEKIERMQKMGFSEEEITSARERLMQEIIRR